MDRMILNTEEPELAHRNGQTVTVMETRFEPTETDADNHIHRVRFRDGFQAVVWPEELVTLTATAPAYRDTL